MKAMKWVCTCDLLVDAIDPLTCGNRCIWKNVGTHGCWSACAWRLYRNIEKNVKRKLRAWYCSARTHNISWRLAQCLWRMFDRQDCQKLALNWRLGLIAKLLTIWDLVYLWFEWRRWKYLHARKARLRSQQTTSRMHVVLTSQQQTCRYQACERHEFHESSCHEKLRIVWYTHQQSRPALAKKYTGVKCLIL